MVFLTDIDSRAAVKGARDPLGIQQIWTRFGRHVVGNLTTGSTSVRDFGVLLLGFHFVEQVAEDVGPGHDVATFIKWEQLASYARAKFNNDHRFRGIERVRRVLAEGTQVCLSEDRAHQTLTNQKMYGLRSLYTGPAHSSGLLEGEPSRLSPAGREIVERHYLPRLGGATGRHASRIRRMLPRKASRLDLGRADEPLFAAVAKALPKKLTRIEREFYRSPVLHGGPQDSTDGRQRQCAELIGETLDEDSWQFSIPAIRQLAKLARARGAAWEPLAHRLDRIATCESVMAPAAMLFSHMLGLHHKTVTALQERLESQWGTPLRTINAEAFADLRDEIAAGDAASGDRWTAVAEGFATGDYAAAIRAIVQENGSVMAGRGGAAWIEIQRGRFTVNVRDERGGLPDRRQLRELWQFPYFLESLRTVAAGLAEPADE